ncbi:MAG: hypothetical protein EBS19_04485 [Spirochaetia bacterium]|nr:hypothetical protein [Spirochaetia bacterium]
MYIIYKKILDKSILSVFFLTTFYFVLFKLSSEENLNLRGYKNAKFNSDFYIYYTSDKPMPSNIIPRMTNRFIEDNAAIMIIIYLIMLF